MEGLSVRAKNTLRRSGIRTLEDLLQADLERLKVGGLKTQKEILEYRKDIEEGEMIKIKNMEITQENDLINIDVLDHEGSVDYYFELEAEELEDFLVQYQKENEII